jgi:hypothetical protein
LCEALLIDMVFAPTRDLTPQAHEPATAPRRPDHVAPPAARDPRERLPWRAVIHVVDRDAAQTTWHLSGCTLPLEHSAHCPEGQRLLASVGDPDGHCLIEGTCARCELLAEPV